MESSLETTIRQYVTPPEVVAELGPIPTVMLTGITAAGKDTTIGDILQDSEQFARVITSTTRAPRENNGVMEVEGREYYFLTEAQALENINTGKYIEVAPVHDRINGSLIAEYRRIAGMSKIALTDINYEGAGKFLTFGMENLSVYFVMPPSFEIWLARLMKRQGGGIGDIDETLRRFRSARAELANALEQPDFIPITNDVSRDTAHKIIEYATSGTGPSVEERQRAQESIRELDRQIGDYITQLEETR